MGNDEVKIGSRVLSKTEMKILLENYEDIFSEVNQIRLVAQKYNEEAKNIIEREYLKSNNNVFSILGSRGSGKSSVLLTLKKMLSQQNNNDIMLPIILPETMGKNSDMLGWILGLLRDSVEDIEEDIFYNKKYKVDGFFKDCRKEEDNPLRQAYNDALKQYRYTQDDYKEILKEQYSSFQEYIQWASKSLDPENRMIQCFHNFIDTIIKVQNQRKEEATEPLLLIFLDDVDLSRNRCEEVLDIVLRYLSHPNIVTFVGGDYSMFNESLYISYLNKNNLINLLNPTLGVTPDIENLLKSNHGLAEDAIKKILPPALRYKLKQYTNSEKLGFVYGKEENQEDQEDKTLWGLIKSRFNDLPISESCIWNTKNNLVYGNIFDNTPRSIMNIYYALLSMHKLDRSDEEKISDNLKTFVNVIISTSTELSTEEEKIQNIIKINKNLNYTFIDYSRILDLDSKLRMRVFIFVNLIENIVVNYANKTNPRRRKIHGQYELLGLINTNNDFKLFPNISDVNLILQMHEILEDKISFHSDEEIKNDNTKSYFIKQYFQMITQIGKIESNDGEQIVKLFDNIASEDIQWAKEKFEVIAYHKNILLITMNEVIDDCIKELKEVSIHQQLLDQISSKLLITLGENLKEVLNKEITINSNINKDEPNDASEQQFVSNIKEEIKKIINDKKIDPIYEITKNMDTNIVDINKLNELKSKLFDLKLELSVNSSKYILNEEDASEILEILQQYKNNYRKIPDYLIQLGIYCNEREFNKEQYKNMITKLERRNKIPNKKDLNKILQILKNVEEEVLTPFENYTISKSQGIEKKEFDEYVDNIVQGVLIKTFERLNNTDIEYYLTFSKLHNILNNNENSSYHKYYKKISDKITIRVK